MQVEKGAPKVVSGLFVFVHVMFFLVCILFVFQNLQYKFLHMNLNDDLYAFCEGEIQVKCFFCTINTQNA